MKLVVILSVLAMASATNFNCENLTPLDSEMELAETETPFDVIVGDTGHRCVLDSGSIVPVSLNQNPESFTSFILGARAVGLGMDSAFLGTWRPVDSEKARAEQCYAENDHVTQKDAATKNHMAAMWTVPSVEVVTQVEFVGTASNGSDMYWEIMSVLCEILPHEEDIAFEQADQTPTETVEEPSEADVPATADVPEVDAAPEVAILPEVVHVAEPEDDPHSSLSESKLKADIMQQQQELMDLEDRESEGDWQLTIEHEKREHQRMIDWEQNEYERTRAEEEHARQERIHWEIMEQEEHDMLEHQRQVEEQRRQEEEQLLGEEMQGGEEMQDAGQVDFMDVNQDLECAFGGTCGAAGIAVSFSMFLTLLISYYL